MRTLTPEDMTHAPMAIRIAARLKQFHSAPITLKDSTDEGKAEPFRTLWKWYAPCMAPSDARSHCSGAVQQIELPGCALQVGHGGKDQI